MTRGRRIALLGLGAVAVGAPVLWVASRPAALQSPAFDSTEGALRTLVALKTQPLRSTGAWDLAHVLHHAAQSVEYSLQGFPALKPGWFRASVGPVAATVFSARGRMSHSLTEPIPGAPDIAQGQPLAPAVDRAIAALQAFERHTGALHPHFAYGELSKDDYRRAHLMHFANHWQEVV
ncbi:DUF1569 domain-containing protein [Piscinibacter gummiphilus]|uniref:DUF1569 domain-containing protein n=1 Tax=Piscinibacter gummiphilus TaxID=946333 RepID=A0ABZ0CWI0_9BURK|nr:DUF1569 domain-containing protein [Piscinibacter gummiphilus]WOB09325.1 DUF1569 domain-containing protein [Piscinibacter gummiphilus]